MWGRFHNWHRAWGIKFDQPVQGYLSKPTIGWSAVSVSQVSTVSESISQSCPPYRMEEPTDISLIVIGVFILAVALCALVALVIRDEAATTPKPPELPLIPISAQQLEAVECSPTDSNPPTCAQSKAVAQDTSRFNLGRPQKKSSTMLPMYMDGSDESTWRVPRFLCQSRWKELLNFLLLKLPASCMVYLKLNDTTAGTGPKE